MENGTKACNKCKLSLSVAEFYKDSSRPDGLAKRCKNCKSKDGKKYWLKSQSDADLKQKETLRRREAFKKWRASGKQKVYRESSPENWLLEKFASLKSSAKRRKLSVEIDGEYLIKLWYSQNGKCALTKISMSHKFNSLFSASADRIDSNIGYVEGNIQLVCTAINLAKNDYTDSEILQWIEALKNGE